MSLPRHDSARGRWSDEEIDEYRRRLVRYWMKCCPSHAEDLAQEGVLQILSIEVSAWQGRAKLSTYLQRVGIFKGIDSLRRELRRERNAKLGGECLTRANGRMTQNPGRFENAMIAFLDAHKDDDDQKMAAIRKKRRK